MPLPKDTVSGIARMERQAIVVTLPASLAAAGKGLSKGAAAGSGAVVLTDASVPHGEGELMAWLVGHSPPGQYNLFEAYSELVEKGNALQLRTCPSRFPPPTKGYPEYLFLPFFVTFDKGGTKKFQEAWLQSQCNLQE